MVDLKKELKTSAARRNVVTFRAIRSDAETLAAVQRKFGLERSAAIRFAIYLAADLADTDVPALVAEVERLRKLITDYAEAHDEYLTSANVSEMYAAQDRYIKAQQAIADEAGR